MKANHQQPGDGQPFPSAYQSQSDNPAANSLISPLTSRIPVLQSSRNRTLSKRRDVLANTVVVSGGGVQKRRVSSFNAARSDRMNKNGSVVGSTILDKSRTKKVLHELRMIANFFLLLFKGTTQ